MAILLAAAVVGGMIAHRLKQPVILGYLVIGVAIGPHALGLVGDQQIVEAMATIGVALLMFTLGLETSFSQLRQIGRVGSLGGFGQIVATFAIGLLVGVVLFRWPMGQAALFGLIISLSSTAVCLKVLMDRGELDSVHGRIMIAILILQDVSVVVMTVIVPLMGSPVENLLTALAIAAGKAALFSAIAIVSGIWILPWLMGRIGGIRTRELFLMTVLVLCLGAALGTQIFGLSSVFGAFLIGLILHQSKFAHHALAEITPLRDIFATLFFVSLGMLLDPVFFLENWGLVAAAVAIIIAVKVGVVFGIVRLFGYPHGVAALTAASLFQVGEFAFILAQAGIVAGIVSEQFYSLILASAIVTMLLTPISMSLMGRYYRDIDKLTPFGLSRLPQGGRDHSKPKTRPSSVVIAGYGRIGVNMARGLEEAGVPFTIIDLDTDRIKAARKMGRTSVYGDASNPKVLSAAGIENASVLAVAFPDPLAVVNTVSAGLALNPSLRAVARVHREKEANDLRELGDVELVSPEHEASLEFIRRTLKSAGWKQARIEKAVPEITAEDRLIDFAEEEE